MKTPNQKVPEFDEIIFRDRNKTYGAYDLRKRYNSAATWSLFGGITISILLILMLTFRTEKSTATPGPTIVTLVMSDPVTTKVAPPPEQKPEAGFTNAIKNLRPVVTDDTSQVTNYMPTAEELQGSNVNGSLSEPEKTIDTTQTSIPVEPEPVLNVQEMPEFPGGNVALLKFMSVNISYPEEASKNNVQGKVMLKFVVKSDGSVDRIEVYRGVDPLLDAEAVRVVKTLPKFKPGKQGGIPVPVWFILPVNFRLDTN